MPLSRFVYTSRGRAKLFFQYFLLHVRDALLHRGRLTASVPLRFGQGTRGTAGVSSAKQSIGSLEPGMRRPSLFRCKAVVFGRRGPFASTAVDITDGQTGLNA